MGKTSQICIIDVIILTEPGDRLLFYISLRQLGYCLCHTVSLLEIMIVNRNVRCANGFFKSLLPVALLGAIAISPAQAYELIDLGEYVEPRAINNFGVVVGSSNTNQYPATAFSWSSGGGFDLIKGGISANAVNDAGQIAGSTVDGAFILDGNYRDWSDYGAFGIN